jgi:hypothetical protein
MPRTSLASSAATFTKLLSNLLAERQACAARLAEIDGLFGRYGITLDAAKVEAGSPQAAAPKAARTKAMTMGAGKRKLHRNSKLYKAKVAALRKAREARWAKYRAAHAAAPEAKARVGKERKRRTYEQTSDQFILGALSGGKALTTAQINTAWKQQGRKGTANNTLTALVQQKKLARKDNQGGRGSLYSLA